MTTTEKELILGAGRGLRKGVKRQGSRRLTTALPMA